MSDWLEDAGRRIAAATGDTPDEYTLAPNEVDALLDLARVAAHDSGERTNAPLVSYLVGLAHGRSPDASLADLAREAAGGAQ